MQSWQPYRAACRDQVDEFLNEIDLIDFYLRVTRKSKKERNV